MQQPAGDSIPDWITAIVAVAAAAGSALWAVADVRVRRLPYLRPLRIHVAVPRELRGPRFKLGVLHVRDGKDSVVGDEPPANRIHWVKDGCVTLWHDCRLGAQFKCFVDFHGVSFSNVKRILSNDSFSEVCLSTSTKENRAWFLISDGRYERVTTRDGYVNNFGTIRSGPLRA